jgi:hypothetical protein
VNDRAGASPVGEFDVGFDYFFNGAYAQRQAEIPGNPSARDSAYFYVQTDMRFQQGHSDSVRDRASTSPS